MNDNPFPVSHYEKPEYFCDRQNEARALIRAIENKRNTTIFSSRRIGKTGLIQHCFYNLSKRKDTYTIYLDILGTSNLKEFVRDLAAAVIGKLDSKMEKFVQKASSLVKALRPKISYDLLTGEPEITIDIDTEKQATSTLDEVFAYLKERAKKNKIIIAIDEFQQVMEYPEKQTEALLRSKIQFLPNVAFIFSGSMKHLLVDMFTNTKRPFYQSTDLLELDKINSAVYTEFIRLQLKKGMKKITDEDILYILQWTRGITFYVQSVCNRLYYHKEKNLKREHINETLYEILKEREAGFYNLRSLLATQQWKLLLAIAKEDGVKEPTGFEFMNRYGIGANSTVRTALKALLEKEMVVKEDDKYQVYDVFFSRWLGRF